MPQSYRSKIQRLSKLLVSKLLAIGALLLIPQSTTLAKSLAFTAVSGKPIRVAAYHSWDPLTCKSNSASLVVATKPSHGVLIPHVTDHTITTSRFGAVGHCFGKPIRALQIDYRPNSGYRGTDSFVIDVTFGYEGRHDIDAYTITVE